MRTLLAVIVACMVGLPVAAAIMREINRVMQIINI